MKKYTATAAMCMAQSTYSGIDYIVGTYMLKIAGMAAMLMIWRALFLQGADMEGLTLNQMYLYTILSTLLAPILDVRTPLSSWLHEGTLLSVYQRPASVFGQLAAHTVGAWVVPLAVMTVPALVSSVLLGVDVRPANMWFLLSICLSAAQGFAVDFLFAGVMIRLNGLEWPLMTLRSALTALLSGAVIPFAALPWGIGKYLAYAPLGTLAGAPLAIYTGIGDVTGMLIAQAVWTLVLWPLALISYRKLQEKMVSYGG